MRGRVNVVGLIGGYADWSLFGLPSQFVGKECCPEDPTSRDVILGGVWQTLAQIEETFWLLIPADLFGEFYLRPGNF